MHPAQGYVVEIMLGRMDESHIVRCIEYWDLEQNRSPRLDHCAVLVAEDLTARFQNVLRLIHRVIPIIVLELSAIEVAGKLVLHFTRVFDEPRSCNDAPDGFGRDFWEARGCKASLQIMDQCLEILRELDPRLDAIYRRQHVSVGRDQHANNLVTFRPMKHFLRVDVKTANARAFRARYQEDELQVLDIDYRWRSLRLLLGEAELQQHRDLLRRVFHSALREAAGNHNGGQMQLWTDAEGRRAE